MARTPTHQPLDVYINLRRCGSLEKAASGAISFNYDPEWLSWPNTFPISLSMPLRETAFSGGVVSAYFENLLPDEPGVLVKVAGLVGAQGMDAYSLLERIGRDCVGALQLFPKGERPIGAGGLRGMDPSEVEALLSGLPKRPLGLSEDTDIRISIAGAQNKTALIYENGQWLEPSGDEPTTHILKPPIGKRIYTTDTLDLSDSVENEYYCLKLFAACGFSVARTEIMTFGEEKALVVERFDRIRSGAGILYRLPQEDMCQALGVPPSRKYEKDGGPGIAAILKVLNGSDTPFEDQLTFFKSQILFWLIGATDGHAKNFSIALKPGGRFRLTPLYDVLSLQPHVDAGQLRHKAFTLAMKVGDGRENKIHYLLGRHFRQTAAQAGLGTTLVEQAFAEVRRDLPVAFDKVEAGLPPDFPVNIHGSIKTAALSRLKWLED